MRKIFDNWKKTAVKIADFQIHLILSILYYFLILPYFIGFKISLFFRKKDQNPATSWIDIPQKSRSLESLRRQF